MSNRYAEEPTTGGPYLSLKSGDKARLRIVSTPLKFEETFKPQGGEAKTVARWGWAVLHKWKGADEKTQCAAKTFKAGSTIYGQIRKLIQDDDWGDPTKYDIEIERTGEGLDTKYTVIPKPKNDATDPKPEHLALFAEHGYDASDEDWADAWITRQYVKDPTALMEEADPFSD